MKAIFLLLPVLLLAGCSGSDRTSATTTAEPAEVTASRPAGPTKQSRQARLAAIKASGRTGLWADVADVCHGKHERAVLMWNVQLEPSNRVGVYLVGGGGSERLVSRGAAVGERQTGPWVRAGMTFVLRAEESRKELARLVIGEKSC